MWDSIITGDPCKMKGAYGWFKKAGTNSVFIRETIYGCSLDTGNQILTWSQIENPDKAGDYEGFYCTVPYTKGDASVGMFDIYVKTLSGELDFKSWDSVPAEDWCKESADVENDTCMRQSFDQWNRILTEPQVNYPLDDQGDNLSAASCSAFRKSETSNNYMAIKNGIQYSVMTGYKVYATEGDFDNGTVLHSDSGVKVEMVFEAAAALAVGAALFSSALAI